MSIVHQILIEGFGNTDKTEVLAAVNEIRSQGQINPFNSTEVLLDNKVLVEVGFFDGSLWVSSITSIEKGGGSYAMKIICDAADKHGVIIRLSPEPYGKKTLNKSQLTTWYKKLGFKKSEHSDMQRDPIKKINEDVKLLDTFKTKEPLKDTDKIRVYHGFNRKDQALTALKFGLSGQETADRIYSFEWVNNPKGLFVTVTFDIAKKFCHSGIILEFDTLVSNLEAPVWAGQDGYFVQGQYTKGFKDDAEREAEVLRKRDKYTKEDPEGYSSYAPNQRVSKSDRPELAYSLMGGGENQALFIGNLNSNNIKYIWFHKELFFNRMTTGDYVRMDKKTFIKTMKAEYDKLKNDSEGFRKVSEKYFKPNEEFDIDKLKKALTAQEYNWLDYLKIYGRDTYYLARDMYPKQAKALIKWLDDNNIPDESRGYKKR